MSPLVVLMVMVAAPLPMMLLPSLDEKLVSPMDIEPEVDLALTVALVVGASTRPIVPLTEVASMLEPPRETVALMSPLTVLSLMFWAAAS